VASVYEDWLQRGRVHAGAGRPIDALLCFRRAAQASPEGPDARFHLGEMLWGLGLAGDAVQAWRDTAQVDSQFVAPRIALAEALLTRADYDGARSAAAEAVALAPDDHRARAAQSVAAAALGDAAAFSTFAEYFSAHPDLAMLPGYAAALARALERIPRGEMRSGFIAELVPMAANLPSILLAPVIADAFADDAATLADMLRTRVWQRHEIEALRRIIIAVHPVDPALARELASTHAAMCVAEPLPLPSLWPVRTGGASLRVAWLLPAPDSASFAPACAVVRDVLQQPGQPDASVTVVCAGDPAATRAALPELPANAAFLPLPPHADATHARALAASDPDVLIDLAGLHATTGLFLAARPARNVWSLAVVAPAHAPALVERVYASSEQLTDGLRALRDATISEGPVAAELAEWWNAAVRAHQQGDEDGATAGYARVLAAQPNYAPAHRLGAVLARDRGDHDAAANAFERAVALAPDDAETRVAAAQLAVAAHQPQRAADMLRVGLERTPYRVELWNALGHAELARRDGPAAAQAFGQALRLAPAGGQTYFNLGVALQMTGDVDEAVLAYQRAMVLQPDFAAACFNLGVLFQQQGRVAAAIAAYRQALTLNPRDAAAYKNLGEVLFAAGRVDAWLANFRVFETQCPASLSLAVQALEVCQLTGDHEKLDRYLDGLRREKFPANDELELVDALEELLFLLLNFDVEPEMLLKVASTYDAAASHVYGAARPRQEPRRPGKLRLGYLSGDLRDHVMGKQMWQAISRHDREKFELHFYATTGARDAWTEKFEGIADRFEVVAKLGDADAADVIARDDLDLLVDLSTHTKGARPGILSTKPARVQITHIASCGAVGLSAIDYKLTDRFADLPENQAFMLETLLPMEGCVYPWRRVSPAPGHPHTRNALGIAQDSFVIGAFVSPLKLSRRCLSLWRDVLERVPRARLLFSPNNEALRPLYVKIAAAAGIAANRLLFLPQGRDEHENQSRYELVDIVLDTLPYGGVNGTMEALAMGVPVVTLVGKRHGERSTYSILANLGVTATVAHGGREYADIAVRLATDPAFMAEVRAAVRANLQASVLTDIDAHARHLEAAYLRAIAERAPETPANAG
jgi:predicted O-linked N-acetylglucosamine transferase (SPINDLY family)